MSPTDDQDGDLQALLRGLAQPEPSAQLDAAILADAEQALAAPAANDPAYPNPRRDFLNRYRVPLSLAATLVITVNLALQKPEEEQAAPVAMEMVSADIAPQAPEPEVRDTGTVRDRREVAVIAKPAPKAEARQAPASARAPVSAPVANAAPTAVPDAPAAAPAPVAAAPAAAAAPAPAFAPAPPAPAPVAEVSPATPAADAGARQRKLDAPAAAPLGLAAAPLGPEPSLRAVLSLEKEDPQAAALAWRDFKRRHPDYPVEQALRARLDALPLPPE